VRLSAVGWCGCLLVVGLVAAAGGCGSSDRPELGTVEGTVTLDGSPLADAMVLFTPDGPGRTSIGSTAADGRYELVYLRDIMGANPGRHTVRITTGSEEEGRAERLPARYHEQTELEAMVEPGSNTIDFSLEP